MEDAKLSFIPLGGATEIGKNLYVYRYRDQLLVVDCGLMFPTEEMLGVDVVIPDISYLLEHRDQVQGIVLTHGHEDHIGALPHVLKQLPVPIWTRRLTLGMVQRKLHEHGLWADTDWHLAEAGERVKIGEFDVEFVHVCHSIPDACSLIIRTPGGIMVHTGDFKLDQTPQDGRPTDLTAFSRAGEEGVLGLVTDSTNIDKTGYVPSEKVVYQALDEVFHRAKGRVIVTSFASNINRVQQVIDISRKYGRRVALSGRSMEQNSAVARDLGYLTVGDETMLRLDQVKDVPPESVTIITTGSQGEPLSALTRMANGDHRHIQIQPGDTVIFSATAVPGNEDAVHRTINNLFKLGADVIYTPVYPNIHVSGHANREELKLIVNLLDPAFIIPVHGEYRHQELWRRVADEMEYVAIKLENGDVLELSEEEAVIVGKVRAGAIFVDGTGMGGMEDTVLRDRWHLSQDGIFVVVMSIDSETNRPIVGPEIITRGAVLVGEEESVTLEAKRRVLELLEELPEEGSIDWSVVRTDIRRSLNKLLQQVTGRRPMVLPILMEI